MSKAQEDFDLIDVYETQIRPLMDQILDICQKHRMPMVAGFHGRRKGDDNDTCVSYLSFDGRVHEGCALARRILYTDGDA